MSRLFILFLIALLPLRGWSVERMAVQMEGMPRAAQSQSLDAGMSAECALHMQRAVSAEVAQTGYAADHKADHQPDHKGCQSCQLCMPLAGVAGGVELAVVSPPQLLPRSQHIAFVSADTARNAKPPIS